MLRTEVAPFTTNKKAEEFAMPDVAARVGLSSLVVDCTDLAPFLVDVPKGALRGKRTEQPGYAEVVQEIETNQEKLGERAGITKLDFDSFQDVNRCVSAIDERLPALRKLLEMLEETRAIMDDVRQRQVSGFVISLVHRAKNRGDNELLARYEKTRTYRSAIAMKGLKTRLKKVKGETEKGR